MTYDLTMTRLIPATPEEVFDAYTDPEKQRIWFSILSDEPGYVKIEADLRVGGEMTNVWGPRNEVFTNNSPGVRAAAPPRGHLIGRPTTA